MKQVSALRGILAANANLFALMLLVRSLQLPSCWIGAGFIRNAVWDHLHGYPSSGPSADVDVIWFDPRRVDPSVDKDLEERLRSAAPSIEWSVKNQARMHMRNGDRPYTSAVEAMRHWPETATAVAVRATQENALKIAAPFGLDDLFALILRPTPSFIGEKQYQFLDRIQTKGWLRKWPRLRVELPWP